MKLTARHTVRAAYIGYLTQAITINFAPLLFVTFEETYNISLGKIGLLIGISFLTQLLSDVILAKISSHLNTRAMAVIAQICAVVGMTGFAYMPSLFPDPYIGLMLATVIAALGGGIIEVFISPMVEAAPIENKSGVMSLVHSFYCWGLAGVVLLSTLFFKFVGIEHWRLLACLWAIIPALGAVVFCFVPIYELNETIDERDKDRSIFRSSEFWLLFIIMFCAGAAEQAMGQWASTFAETGLGVDKWLGDLLGPCAFAVLMGTTRVLYGSSGGKISLRGLMKLSAILCAGIFIVVAISPYPWVSLLGCALCGLTVGVMWPGTLSLAAGRLPYGGVQMFAFLAMAGDIGCLIGPTSAGWIAEAAGNDLQVSFLVSAIFPLIMFITICICFRKNKKNKG